MRPGSRILVVETPVPGDQPHFIKALDLAMLVWNRGGQGGPSSVPCSLRAGRAIDPHRPDQHLGLGPWVSNKPHRLSPKAGVLLGLRWWRCREVDLKPQCLRDLRPNARQHEPRLQGARWRGPRGPRPSCPSMVNTVLSTRTISRYATTREQRLRHWDTRSGSMRPMSGTAIRHLGDWNKGVDGSRSVARALDDPLLERCPLRLDLGPPRRREPGTRRAEGAPNLPDGERGHPRAEGALVPSPAHDCRVHGVLSDRLGVARPRPGSSMMLA
jgi:hypothetical protein